MICRQIQSNFEAMHEIKGSENYSIKICHNALLINVDDWLYISRFKITDQAITFSIIMKCNSKDFEIRDTVDCNFLVLQQRKFKRANHINIFYDTLNDKFVHHVCDNGVQFSTTEEALKLHEVDKFGIKLSDQSQPLRPVKYVKGHPDTLFMLINPRNFLTLA